MKRKNIKCFLNLTLFAEHKSISSTSNGRDSISKRLGIKVNNKQCVKKGGIIILQHGWLFYPGKNTFISKNHSIHSYINGYVKIKKKKKIGKKKYFKLVNVYKNKF